MSSLVLSRRVRDLALVASISLIPLTGWAQPVPVLKETVVTGTRLPIPMADRIADVTVIDRAEIERSAVSSVAELLARQHGVEMSANGCASSSSTIVRACMFAVSPISPLPGTKTARPSGATPKRNA